MLAIREAKRLRADIDYRIGTLRAFRRQPQLLSLGLFARNRPRSVLRRRACSACRRQACEIDRKTSSNQRMPEMPTNTKWQAKKRSTNNLVHWMAPPGTKQ